MNRAYLLLLPLGLAACASLGGGGASAGAESPTAAIQQFLDGARRKDLSSIAAVWGTAGGPASKTMSTKELERRELIMIQCLGHEKATLGASSPGEGGRLKIPVRVMAASREASPVFTVVRGPHNRWFVENLELDQLRDQGFCSAPTTPTK